MVGLPKHFTPFGFARWVSSRLLLWGAAGGLFSGCVLWALADYIPSVCLGAVAVFVVVSNGSKFKSQGTAEFLSSCPFTSVPFWAAVFEHPHVFPPLLLQVSKMGALALF